MAISTDVRTVLLGMKSGPENELFDSLKALALAIYGSASLGFDSLPLVKETMPTTFRCCTFKAGISGFLFP